MKSKLSQMLFLALLGCSATAAAAAAAAPAITPAPLVVRAVTTVGYMSTGTARGTTLCKCLDYHPHVGQVQPD